MSTSPPKDGRGRGGRGTAAAARSGSGSPTALGQGLGLSQTLNTIPPNVVVKPGDLGTPIKLQTNFIQWTLRNMMAHGYHVTFTPEIENVSTRRRLVEGLGAEVIGVAFLYDGDANMKTLDEIQVLQHNVQHPHTNANVVINFMHTGEINMNSPEMFRLYNTQGRRNMRLMQYIQIGLNYYNPESALEVRGFPMLQLWFGVDTTINIYVDAPLMVLNSISKIVRRDTARDYMREVLERCRHTRQDFKVEVRKNLVGRIVLTTYNNRFYRIADVAFNEHPTDTFIRTNPQGDQIETSYADYLQNQYQVTVTDPKQPMLVSILTGRDQRAGKTDAPRLVPEFCKLTGLGDLALNTQLKREMIATTKKSPGQRVIDIYAFMGAISRNQQVLDEMNRWGMGFARNLLEVTGRVFDPERIHMADGKSFLTEKGDIERGMRNLIMPQAVPLTYWTVVVPRRDEHTAQTFVRLVYDAARRFGMNISKPHFAFLNTDRIGDYINTISQLDRQNQLIMPFIGRQTETEKYSQIKRLVCVDQPVPSQVIVLANASDEKKQRSMAAKVAIQINCKLGGVPWQLEIPPKDLMVIGFDVHHDTVMRRSVGGFVSSLDANLTRWYSRVNYHDNLQELSTHFRRNVRESLNTYRKHNGKLPARIVIYRDGVSDGQIPHVFQIERNEIMKALEEVSPVDAIRVALIIVTKRVAARFFTWAAKKGDQNNPPCGTVVDTKVTRLNRYDFYLISQSIRQGTVAPVNYNIVEDTVGWSLTNHQRLAYKLCHLYFNWAGTVKVPAPCQYAHKLAYLTGCYIHSEPSPRLCEQLFFL